MNKNDLVLSVMFAVVGLLMIFASEQVIQVIVILLGVGAVVNGFITLITIRPLVADPAFRTDMVIRGWLSLIVGILAVVLPLTIAKVTWEVMVYVLAVYLVISACLELYGVYKMHGIGLAVKNYVIEAVVTLAAAVILFMLPASFGLAVVKIMGGCMITGGVVLAVYTWKNRTLVEEPVSVADDESTAEDGNDLHQKQTDSGTEKENQ